MNEKMKSALKNTLESDERVLWESGVTPYRLFDGKEGRGTLILWVVVIALAAGAIVSKVSSGEKGIGFYVIVAVILAAVILSPILACRQINGQRYYITDRRVLSIRPDGTVSAMDRSNIDAVRLYKVDCGGAALAMGSGLLEEKDKQLRWRANHPMVDGNFNVQGLVFYRVKGAEEAMRLLGGTK